MGYELSDVSRDYINTFQRILSKMIKSMTEAELTESISHNFIVQMIPHHRAAIEMSKNILRYTTNIQIQNIALNIISEQTESIENMRKIKCDCMELTNSEQDICSYQKNVNQIMNTMFHNMENAYTSNQINLDFIYEMIPHHKGAIEMSNNALQYNICPQLKPILYAIINSQQKGIIQMRKLIPTFKY